MAYRNNTITHKGKVTDVSKEIITVVIPRSSACSGCHAKGICSSVDSRDNFLTIPNKDGSLTVNDEVSVSIHRSIGFKAVLYAFVLPLALMLVVLFSLYYLSDFSEGAIGLISLFSLVPYFIILHLLNSRISKQFVFHIEKLQ